MMPGLDYPSVYARRVVKVDEALFHTFSYTTVWRSTAYEGAFRSVATLHCFSPTTCLPHA